MSRTLVFIGIIWNAPIHWNDWMRAEAAEEGSRCLSGHDLAASVDQGNGALHITDAGMFVLYSGALGWYDVRIPR